MRWKQGRRSRNVEDRRGQRGKVKAAGGLGGGVLLIAIVAMLFGVDPRQIMQIADSAGLNKAGSPQTEAPVELSTEDLQESEFIKVVLGDTEDVWNQLFPKMSGGKAYEEPKLVLFAGAVESACGHAQATMGPFYCPGDHKVYIDLSFYDDLRQRYQAPGDFAQAYVIAHEVGHHIQNLLGISRKVQAARSRLSKEEYNALSVRLELQADFFAGVWAHHAHKARDILERGDIEEALNAAAAIGDDRLQKQSQGFVVPESFTHGTSAQRARWFRKGLETGDVTQGDTFSAREL